jgi:hypothetical protein
MMHIAVPELLRLFLGLPRPQDEPILGGADEESIQTLGVSQPVLGQFQPSIAVLCPDLVHEAQLGLSRR